MAETFAEYMATYGARYEGFDATAPGRSHGRPAVRGVTVLIGVQTDADPQS